jgi:hypothetical protein
VPQPFIETLALQATPIRGWTLVLSMISAQTRSAFVARENWGLRIGSWPEGMLFRIML